MIISLGVIKSFTINLIHIDRESKPLFTRIDKF